VLSNGIIKESGSSGNASDLFLEELGWSLNVVFCDFSETLQMNFGVLSQNRSLSHALQSFPVN
jgi:hypothetical protein